VLAAGYECLHVQISPISAKKDEQEQYEIGRLLSRRCAVSSIEQSSPVGADPAVKEWSRSYAFGEAGRRSTTPSTRPVFLSGGLLSAPPPGRFRRIVSAPRDCKFSKD